MIFSHTYLFLCQLPQSEVCELPLFYESSGGHELGMV